MLGSKSDCDWGWRELVIEQEKSHTVCTLYSLMEVPA